MVCYASASIVVIPVVVIGAAAIVPVVIGAAAIAPAVWAGEVAYRAWQKREQEAQKSWQADAERRIQEAEARSESQALATEIAIRRWQAANPGLSMPEPLEVERLAQEAQAAAAGAGETLRREAEEGRRNAAQAAQVRLDAALRAASGDAAQRARLEADAREGAADVAYEIASQARMMAQQRRRRAASDWGMLRGRLDALSGMAQGLTDQDVLTESDALRAALDTIGEELRRSDQLDQLDRVEMRLRSLGARMDRHADRVEEASEKSQQMIAAETIAAVLQSLGYRESAVGQGAPRVSDAGIERQIVGFRDDGQPGRPQQRRAAFFVAEDGEVRYDLSGFSEEDYRAEHGRIFMALRARNLYLANPEAAEKLATEKAPLSERPLQAELDVLATKEYAPFVDVNLRQGRLRAQAIQELRARGYEPREEMIGGKIVLSAFNATDGYRIVIPPPHTDGDHAHVFRGPPGAASELPLSSDDPLVKALEEIPHVHGPTPVKTETARVARTRRRLERARASQ